MQNVTSRHLNLTGTYNLRDTGGYRTSDGRTTRWRTFLRADSLHRVAPQARTALLDYGVRTIIDLRRSDERRSAPNVFADSATVTYHHVSLLPDTLPPHGVRPRPLLDIYRMILDERQEQLRHAVTTLAAQEGVPAVVHCSAGKDRTGLLVALVLGLVGVPHDTLVADYALSSQYLVGTFLDEMRLRAEKRGIPWEWYQDQVSCAPEFMQATLQYLDTRYGGIDAYVRAIGVSDAECARLRQTLVE